MDAVGAIVLAVTLSAARLYALYWVIRRAVAAGLRDARDPPTRTARPASTAPSPPDSE